MKRLPGFCALVLTLTGIATAQPPATVPDKEQLELSTAVNDAGPSSIDFIRALERHLEKYPQSPQRTAIEKAIVKAAVESNDKPRIILYGEKILNADPKNDDLPLIDRVVRTLLDSDDVEPAKRALPLAKRYEAEVEAMSTRAAEGHMTEGQWAEEVAKGRSRAQVLEARATGNIGNLEEAVKIAQKAWAASPNSEAARETARWLAKAGRDAEAIEAYANAFTLDDGRSTESDRARDRVHLHELFLKMKGSEAGLGEAVMQAYDRMATLKKDRLAKLKAKDPNVGATEPGEFTIPNIDGSGNLSIASLKGKAVVMDFWATWCGPCRAQHPMIEDVKKRFTDADNVVFLSIDADDDHSPVPAFVEEMKWNHKVYYDGGMGSALKITSIPTILILDPAGKVSSRMTGFVPERCEDLLAQRIQEARAAGAKKN